MAFQMDSITIKWLFQLQIINQQDVKQTATSLFQIKQAVANSFQNGTRVAQIVQDMFKKVGLPIPQALSHLKVSNQTAAQLYNWNILNQSLKKIDFQIDAEAKNMIINGDREHLASFLRKLHKFYNQQRDEIEDSLDTQQFKTKTNNKPSQEEQLDKLRESLTLSRSEEPPKIMAITKKASQHLANIEKLKRSQITNTKGQAINMKSQLFKKEGGQQNDLLEFVINQLMNCIKVSRQQAITLLEDNNKYLAHVLVKGVKGQFTEIQQFMEKMLRKVDFVVQRMAQQNDMCFFFLQILKPALLSKSQEVAQWTCRLLSRIAHQLANKDLLPLAYDWFVREAGGLSTSVLALSRHPKLSQQVVGFMLQFSRFNIAQLFTVELKKVTSNDQLSYLKFMLLIFDPLVSSKLSAQQLLNSGAIDYWVQSSLKGSQINQQNSIQLRLYSIQLLTKIWRAYPIHVQESLDKVNEIMAAIKRGIRETSEVMRFTLLQLLFNLLDEFASKKNPYASVVYKKLTFLFIQNHEELNIREFMLRNFGYVFRKYQSIPVQIFLQPFVKQVKIRESKSYFLNIFDFQFIEVVVRHQKLKAEIALELFDLLAKTKLNNYQFADLTDKSMIILLDRFLTEDIFLEYTAKLVKISLAIFYSTFKHKKKQMLLTDQERLNAQKRAEIVNFVIQLVSRSSSQLNKQILEYVVRLKIQIQKKLNTTHKGIERILQMFPNYERQVAAAIQQQNLKEQTESNMSSQNSKEGFRFPKLQPKYLSKDRDEVASQQSSHSQGTVYTNKTKQQFPQQDYTKFAEQDEQNFLKQYGIGFKKKNQRKQRVSETKVNPKVQQQIDKTKLRKQEEQKKKTEEQAKIQRKKELLKNKIQKQLEQRNLLQGIKGIERDVQVRVIFQQNEIDQRMIEDDDMPKQLNLSDQENRDSQSVRLVLKKYTAFLRKLFSKYSSAKVNKKDYFDQDNDNLAQIDLIRLCKQKGLQKNKQVILELIKFVVDKNLKSLSFENFLKFSQVLTVHIYTRDKMSTHQPMGDLIKSLLKKMAVGENFKLQQDQDDSSKGLTQKVKYNPHIQLPQGYKKIYQRVYDPKKVLSYPSKKALGNTSFADCYQVVNELLSNIFKFQIIQEEVRFYEEARVVKKNVNLPPRPLKKQRQEAVNLLQQKQIVPSAKGKRANSTFNKPTVVKTSESRPSLQKDKDSSRPKTKILNAVQKKKIAQQQAKRLLKDQEQQSEKRRRIQTKKKFQKLQEEKQKQKLKQYDQKKAQREQQQQGKRKQKEQKERYRKEQKQKLQKFKRERQEKEKQERQKQKLVKLKQEEQKKQKLKVQLKKQEQKRRQEAERVKKDRQLSQERNKKKKDEDQIKKEQVKKQVLKKLQDQKQKYEVHKLTKELLKKIMQEGDVQNLFNTYKEELKNMYNYAKQYNEYKLGDKESGLEQKGWIAITQQFSLCNVATANALLKQNQKEYGRQGFLYQQFLQVLMGLAVKNDLQANLADYQTAHTVSHQNLQKFLKSLKIPKDKQSMKDYFIGLKNNFRKREMQVKGPNGEKQTWQVQQK